MNRALRVVSRGEQLRQKPQRPDIREKLAGRYESGEIVTCVPVVLEAMHREVTLWCFDRDLQVICAHTGQPCEPEESTGSGH